MRHMGPNEMKELYRRWLQEVWGAGNLELGQELIDENIVDHNPYRGQPEGRRGQDWAVAMVRKAFPDLHFTEDVVLSDGEFVCGRWTMTGTHTGVMDLFHVPPTGRPVAMTGQEIFRVSDGKFTEVWHQEDVPGMLSQLGLEPPALMLRLAAQRSTRRYRRESRARMRARDVDLYLAHPGRNFRQVPRHGQSRERQQATSADWRWQL